MDVLRAVAALGVLIGHAYSLGGRSIPVKAQHFYDVPLGFSATGVALFFAISGYVISRPFVESLVNGRALPDLGGYAIRRATRIFPLYWLALTAVILMSGTEHARAWQMPFHIALLNNLIPGRQGALFSVAWTLTLEVLFYIAVPLLALAVRRSSRAVSAERLALLIVLSWLASIVFTVLADFKHVSVFELWLRGSFFSNWQLFCPGLLLAVAPHLRHGRLKHLLTDLPTTRIGVAVAVAALVLATLLDTTAPLRYGLTPYLLLVDASRPLFAIGYGIILAAAIRARPIEGPSGTWITLGLVSYGIYLLHPVALIFLLQHPDLVPLRNTSALAFVLHAALLAAITIPVALFSWRWFEQPAIRLGRRLSRRRSPAAPIYARSR